MRYLIVLALLASLPAHAGAIKKWVDENGNVHYGDAPPTTAKTQDIRVQGAPSNPGRALPRLSTSGTEQGGAGADTAADAEQPEVPADQAKLACESAQEDLRIIKRSSRIKLRSADGTERYMTEEEIEERRVQSEADVERFCN